MSSRGDSTAPTHDAPRVSRYEGPEQRREPEVNLSYMPSPDLTLYSTVAKGFRPGGANQILPPPNEPP